MSAVGVILCFLTCQVLILRRANVLRCFTAQPKIKISVRGYEMNIQARKIVGHRLPTLQELEAGAEDWLDCCDGYTHKPNCGLNSSEGSASCPDCVEGKIAAGCSIDRPLISVDCGRCKGTGQINLPSTPRPTGETTVEACLVELREMFPKTFIRVRSTTEIEYNEYADKASYRERHAYVLIMKHGEFSAQTLADCMAQVRAATRTEGEGEKL
jgi:hypothetical protein